MIKKIAWDTFKNTGDVNTFLEFKQIQSIEEQIQGQKNIMQEMDVYFQEIGIGSEVEDCSYDFSYHNEPLEEMLDDDEHLELAIESYVRIRDTYKFINEDISSIVNRIDNAYGTI